MTTLPAPVFAGVRRARRRPRCARAALILLAACAAVQPAVSGDPAWLVPGGDAARGARWIREAGCARCHTIPGIENATGNVGPPLTRIGSRTFIAGVLDNNPGNLVRWIRDPQGVVPGNAMPNMGLSAAQARDIAAYLYTLR